jgi:hypothetical protein
MRARQVQENSSLEIQVKIARWISENYPAGNDDSGLAEYKDLIRQVHDITENKNPTMGIVIMRHRYQEAREESQLPLIRILASVFVGGTLKATQPRDRIFAMLGMASDEETLGIEPKYDKSVSDIKVYTDAAYAIITAGHVDLLSLSQHKPRSIKSDEEAECFPSWVPDWNNPIARPSGQLPWDTVFTTSGSKPFEVPPEPSSHRSGQIVCSAGY